MSTVQAPPTQTAPAIKAFAERHGLWPSGVRSDGSLTLTVDRRYRVRLRAATHGRVALQSQLLTLASPATRATDQLLDKLMKLSAGMLREHGSTLCLDARQQSLQLQQMLPANSDVRAMEAAVADFSNALAFWTKVCRSEAAEQ